MKGYFVKILCWSADKVGGNEVLTAIDNDPKQQATKGSVLHKTTAKLVFV